MNVLIIGLGWEQEPLIERLATIPNVKLYGVHYNDNYTRPSLYQKVLVCDLRDKNTILNFAKTYVPEVVISDQDDFAHFTQSFLADYFHLPGPSIREAQISSNKYLQRLRCKETGILHPAFSIISNLEELGSFAIQHGFPIILKPIDNRGSYGVVKINAQNELLSAFLNAVEHSHSGLLIVEQFIEGLELTVDGYCFRNGIKTLAIASKTKLNQELQVSFDIHYPAELPEDRIQELAKVNEKVIEKLGYSFGMTHAEYILNEHNQFYLIEAANRGGGCFTSEIVVPNHCGVDLVGHLINDAFGFEVTNSRNLTRGDVVLKFFNFPPGKVKHILGEDLLKSNKDVIRYRLNIFEGQDIEETNSDGNRHGFVIVKSHRNARKLAEEIMENINVIYHEQ